MAQDIAAEIEEVRTLLKDREHAGGDMAAALKKVRRRLPRRIYKQGMALAGALPLIEHPKLRLTLDEKALHGAARELKAHLLAIDLAGRRKGRVLDILASMGFSILAVIAILVAVLRWRGFV